VVFINHIDECREVYAGPDHSERCAVVAENGHIYPQIRYIEIRIVSDVEVVSQLRYFIKGHVVPIVFREIGVEDRGVEVVEVKQFVRVVYPENRVCRKSAAICGHFPKGYPF
jgi:hypothetical protein